MRGKLTALALSASLWIVSNCHPNRNTPPKPPPPLNHELFHSYDPQHPPPPGWTGPVFELSQDYPQTEPAPETVSWESIDFKTAPAPYLTAVLRYAFEGNLEHDWVVQNNKVRKWYHAPWLHGPELAWGENKKDVCKNEKGREFVHGLTRERYSSLAELNYHPEGLVRDEDTKPTIQNWAVGMYNAPGGWVIGQVWNEMTVHLREPKGRLPKPENISTEFPLGTVAVKLLFTEATPREVPYLRDSPEWDADINRGKGTKKLHLLQVDVAVRDRRAEQDGSGWVFGTFAYHYHSDPVKSAIFDYPAMLVNGKDVTLPWRQLEPVGLTWGNGMKGADGTGTAQTVLASEATGASQHLGCEGRLAGPVDSPWSSCIACHGLAELRNSDSGKAFDAIDYKEENKREKYDQCRFADDLPFWFRTVPFRQTFSNQVISLDLSLQLQRGIIRFCQFNPGECPKFASLPVFDAKKMNLNEMPECKNDAPCSNGRQLPRQGLRQGAGALRSCNGAGGSASFGGGGGMSR